MLSLWTTWYSPNPFITTGSRYSSIFGHKRSRSMAQLWATHAFSFIPWHLWFWTLPSLTKTTSANLLKIAEFTWNSRNLHFDWPWYAMVIDVTLCSLPEWNQAIPIDSNMIPPQFRWIACWPRCVQEVLLGTAWCQWQVKLSSTPHVIPCMDIFSAWIANKFDQPPLPCTCFPRNARASQIECCSQVVADRLKSRRNHSWKRHKSHAKLCEQDSNYAQGIPCIHGMIFVDQFFTLHHRY